MVEHFVVLETISAVLQTLWKHHKSKDRTFLHQSCTQKCFLNSEKIFFRLQKKSFFFGEKNLKNLKCCSKIQILKKSTIVDNFRVFEKCSIFSKSDFFWIFFEKLFFGFFLKLEKHYCFSELRKLLEHSFDVKISDLWIHDVFGAFWAWQVWFPAPRRCLVGAKTVTFGDAQRFPVWGCLGLEISVTFWGP